MSILELTILPPLAIARLGSSQHPLENYTLEVPDDGLDFRRITPAETLYVDASSGEIADARTPDAIVFRGGHHIGPVALFLELFARTAPDRIEPLTIDLLRGHGLSPADVRWTVGIGNIKAFRRTGDQGDKAIARLARISDHAAHPLETTAPNFLPGKCFLSAQCVTSNPMPPHSGRTPFDWLISIANTAKAGLFMTFPFGIVKDFRADVYDKNDDILRYAMLEMYVNGGNKKSRQEAKDDTIRIRRFPNAGMALGSYIKVPTIDGWIKERAVSAPMSTGCTPSSCWLTRSATPPSSLPAPPTGAFPASTPTTRTW